MTLHERAAIVLQQIDAALALSDRATENFDIGDGYDEDGSPIVSQGDYFGDTLIGLSDTYEGCRIDCRFIAASRTLLPKSLCCLKTAIEGLLEMQQWNDTPFIRKHITALCEQWEAGR